MTESTGSVAVEPELQAKFNAIEATVSQIPQFRVGANDPDLSVFLRSSDAATLYAARTDLADYALKTEIPSTVGFLTETVADGRYASQTNYENLRDLAFNTADNLLNNTYNKTQTDNLFLTKTDATTTYSKTTDVNNALLPWFPHISITNVYIRNASFGEGYPAGVSNGGSAPVNFNIPGWTKSVSSSNSIATVQSTYIFGQSNFPLLVPGTGQPVVLWMRNSLATPPITCNVESDPITVTLGQTYTLTALAVTRAWNSSPSPNLEITILDVVSGAVVISSVTAIASFPNNWIIIRIPFTAGSNTIRIRIAHLGNSRGVVQQEDMYVAYVYVR